MSDRRRLLEEESSSVSDQGDASGSGAGAPGADAGYAPSGRSRRHIEFGKLPWGIWLLEKLGFCGFKRRSLHKALVLILTFCCYTTYHLTRKPISVVKIVLNREDNCSYPGWSPFTGDHGKTLLGTIDYSWLFAYAICMFVSGQIADRTNLRYFLTFGMIGSAITVGLMGVAFFANLHHLWYFIIVQLFGGLFQSTGWPGNVAVMGHWFGKHNRGLIMGIWNSHTSVGNILGTIIPSFWADCDDINDPWGWSFIVPAFIMVIVALAIFLFLVNDPRDVGLSPPVHHLEGESDGERGRIVTTTITSGGITGNGVLGTGNGVPGSRNGVPGNNVTAWTTSTNTVIIPEPTAKPKAVNFVRALTIPGVIEYSLALFFNKFVSYTFLFWLPLYIKHTNHNLSGPESDWLSTLFDVGGIIGGIIAGIVSDVLNARAVSCVAMLLLAVPSLFFLRAYGAEDLAVYIVLLIVCGIFINGPYGMITTAVSSDLGTHKSLKGNQNAKATVTAIIDGTGSIGAALGPLIFGLVVDESSYDLAFYVLMACCFTSAVFLSRLIFTECWGLVKQCMSGRSPCSRKPRSSATIRKIDISNSEVVELQPLDFNT